MVPSTVTWASSMQDEEAQVTVDGTTYSLDSPFMVIATQNPIEMEGTYALPEAQRDRFMVRLSMGYPVEAAEIAMLSALTGAPARGARAGHGRGRGAQAHRGDRQRVRLEVVQRYAVGLTTATRRSPISGSAPPPGDAAPDPGVEGVGGDAGPRVRAAGRRTRPRTRGPPSPAAADDGGHDERPAYDRRGGARARQGAHPAAGSHRTLTGRGGDRVRDLTVRGRCFLAAGAAAIICGVQIGERDFVRIGLVAALVPNWPGCCCAVPSARCGCAETSATSRSRPATPHRSRSRSGTPVAGRECC